MTLQPSSFSSGPVMLRGPRRRSAAKEVELHDGTRIPLTPRRPATDEEGAIARHIQTHGVTFCHSRILDIDEAGGPGEDVVLTSADLSGFGIETFVADGRRGDRLPD